MHKKPFASPRFRLVGPALAALLAGACTAPSGPTVTLMEPGKTRQVAAADFDESVYLKRGWIKNTDGSGKTVYVRIPDSDSPKDVTFLTGSDTGKERSFGGLDGHFTGKPGGR